MVIYHQVYTAVFLFVALEGFGFFFGFLGFWEFFWGVLRSQNFASTWLVSLLASPICISDGDCSLKLSKLDLFYFVGTTLTVEQASMVAQKVKNLPAVRETGVRSLGWEDPLEKRLSINSSILVWKIPCTEEPGGLQSRGSQNSWTRLSDLTTTTTKHLGNRKQVTWPRATSVADAAEAETNAQGPQKTSQPSREGRGALAQGRDVT